MRDMAWDNVSHCMGDVVEIQQGWQTSAVAMHLFVAHLVIHVRYFLITSNIDILVYFGHLFE